MHNLLSAKIIKFICRELALVALSCLSSLVLLILFSGLFDTVLKKPVVFQGDSEWSLLNIYDVVHFGNAYANPNISFPFPSELFLLPQMDILSTVMTRFIALFSSNVFLVMNLFAILCILTTVITFYAACRFLQANRFFSACVSVVFSLGPFTLSLIFEHTVVFPLAPIPVGILLITAVCRPAAVQPIHEVQYRFLPTVSIILACGFFVGIGSAYWTFFIVILLLGAGAACFISRPSILLSARLALASASVTGGFLLSWRDVLSHGTEYATNPSAKVPIQQAMLGMNYLDLFLPHHTPLSWLNNISSKYYAIAPVATSPLDVDIGPLAILGFLTLVIVFAFAVFNPRTRGSENCDALALLAFCVVLAMLFSVTNGLGFAFNLFVTPVFRAQIRMGVVIECICLISLAVGLTRLSWTSRPTFELIGRVAFVVACLGSVWVQIGSYSWPRQQKATSINGEYDRHREACKKVAQNLPVGTAVLQLPAAPFIDGGQVFQGDGTAFHTYYHLACPLMTTSLNWSFGIVGGSAQEDFITQVKLANPVDLVGRAVAAGFGAIFVDKRAYADSAKSLVASMGRLLGSQSILFDDSWFALIDLRSPLADLGLPSQERNPPIVMGWAGRGFAPEERLGPETWHWSISSSDAASVQVCNYDNHAKTAKLTGDVRPAIPSTAGVVRLTGLIDHQSEIIDGRAMLDETFDVSSGCHILTIKSPSGINSLTAAKSPLKFMAHNVAICDVEYYSRVKRVINIISPGSALSGECSTM